MLRFIKKSPANIVHIQYPALGYKRSLGINLLPYAVRLFLPKKKIIVTLHEYSNSPILGRTRNLVTIIPAHRIIVSNESDKEALPKIVCKKCKIIPIGSNIPLVKNNEAQFSALMQKVKLDPVKSTLIFFGFAHPSKNIEQIIAAMAGLPDFQLLLVTSLDKDTDYHKELLIHIKASSAEERIGVTGYLDSHSVSIALQNCKYFILPQATPMISKSGSAIAAVCHNSILVTTGNKDSRPFIDKTNVMFLNELTAEEIISKVDMLEENEALQKTIKQNAKDLAKYFDWDSILRAHLKLYSKITSKE
jgi:glycosyltransferase involved in cell wall biosynthesis